MFVVLPGVSFSPNSLVDNSVTPLRELAATSSVIFSVSVLASPTSATVSGTDLWKTTVFLSADQNGAGTRQVRALERGIEPSLHVLLIILGSYIALHHIFTE